MKKSVTIYRNENLEQSSHSIKAIEELPKIELFLVRLPADKFMYLHRDSQIEGYYCGHNHTKTCYVLADSIGTLHSKFGKDLLEITPLGQTALFLNTPKVASLSNERVSTTISNDLISYI